MKYRRLFLGSYCFLIGFSLVGLVISKVWNIAPGPIAPAASVLIILCAVAVMATEIGSWRALAWTGIIASALEICSLFTGFPFGVYEYTDAWFPTLALNSHRFPLLLPGAWILIVWGSFAWMRSFCSGWAAATGTAFLAMFIDLPMERAMMDVFRYWIWTPPGPLFGAPVSNALGWFLTAFLCCAPFRNVAVSTKPSGPKVLGLFCFFVATSGFLAFWDTAWLLLSAIGVCILLVRGRHADASTEDS